MLAQTAAPSRYRIVVVDDGSTDATSWILDAYRERVEIVQMPENRGLAVACNEGLRRIDTPSFLRLDTDDRFDPDLIASCSHAATHRAPMLSSLIGTSSFRTDGGGSVDSRTLHASMN